jgi:hypothetical protein
LIENLVENKQTPSTFGFMFRKTSRVDGDTGTLIPILILIRTLTALIGNHPPMMAFGYRKPHINLFTGVEIITMFSRINQSFL